MKVKVTHQYQASDVKFAQVYEFAEGKVDVQFSFKTDNPFEPVALSFQIDKAKCREIGNKLLEIADQLDKVKPPKISDFTEEEDPADFWKNPDDEKPGDSINS